MRTENYLLIYDDKCPMCSAYTHLFVRTGILDKDSRVSFTKVDNTILKQVDVDRGRNEIPLLNTMTGKVLYGIDALLELLNTKIPFIKTIGQTKLIYWFLKKLYTFISLNRKVIVAVKCNKGQFDCSPEFNRKWRLAFLFFFLFLNTLFLFPIQNYVLANSIFRNVSIVKLQFLHSMLVISNVLLSLTMKQEKAFEYLGQVNVLATLTVIFLLILAVFNKIILFSEVVNNICLFSLLCVMIIEYKRRMQYAGTLGIAYVTLTNAVSVLAFLLFLIF